MFYSRGTLLQQKNLTLVISVLSGKAVDPLVSNPQMTDSAGHATKLVQTLSGLQVVSAEASRSVSSSQMKLTPSEPASSGLQVLKDGQNEDLLTNPHALVALVILLSHL